jgi:hypothetical protein
LIYIDHTPLIAQVGLKDCRVYFLDVDYAPPDQEGTVCSDYFDNSEDAVASFKTVISTGVGFDAVQTDMKCAEIVQTGEVTTITRSAWDRFLEALGF